MEMKIPREIQSKESAFIKGFSIRQCALIALGFAAAAVGYFVLFKNVGTDSRIPLSAVLGVPFFAFAFYKKHGMRFSKYVVNLISDRFLSTKNRTTAYENVYEKWEALGTPPASGKPKHSKFTMVGKDASSSAAKKGKRR